MSWMDQYTKHHNFAMSLQLELYVFLHSSTDLCIDQENFNTSSFPMLFDQENFK